MPPNRKQLTFPAAQTTIWFYVCFIFNTIFNLRKTISDIVVPIAKPDNHYIRKSLGRLCSSVCFVYVVIHVLHCLFTNILFLVNNIMDNIYMRPRFTHLSAV